MSWSLKKDENERDLPTSYAPSPATRAETLRLGALEVPLLLELRGPAFWSGKLVFDLHLPLQLYIMRM